MEMMTSKLAIEIPVGSVGGRVRKGLFVSKGGGGGAEIQTRGNDLGEPSLLMSGQGIWHLGLGVEEPALDVEGTSCNLPLKTFPLSFVF